MVLALVSPNAFAGGAVVRAAPEAPASGGTITVNSAGDTATPGTTLTLREALLIARGGTGAAKGLGRALTTGEKGQLIGCTIDGSNFIIGGCGAGFSDTIYFNLSLAATIMPGTPLPLIDDSAPTVIDGVGVFPIINASSVGPLHNGLFVASDGNTVQNLEVNAAPNDDFHVDGKNNLLHNVWALSAGRYGAYLGASNNEVDASLVGVNNGPTCFGNSSAGIYIEAAATGNIVQNRAISCNGTGVIVGNLGGAGSNTIGPNNVIGTDSSAAIDVGNGGNGLFIDSDSNVVFSNTIAFNHGSGIDIARGMNSLTGNTVISNTGSGLLLHGVAHSNYIGCSAPFCFPVGGNRFSANLRYGIELTGTAVAVNYAAGNLIGTTASGFAAQGNVLGGLLVDGAHDNFVGTANAGLNNISGNFGNGVTLDHGANNTTLSNNCIGERCTSNGFGPMPNGGRGVVIQGGAHDNTLGLGGVGLGNDIEWNGQEGVLIGGASTGHNTVNNNYVNWNHIAGILIGASAHDNVIGSDTNNRNTIDFNLGDGVALNGGAYSNTVGYNYVGTDGSFSNNGNAGNGVTLSTGAHDNTVGQSNNPSYVNEIYGNHLLGILIDGSGATLNTISRNRIHQNLLDGIHLSNGANNTLIGQTDYADFNSVYDNRSGLVLTSGAHDNHIGFNAFDMNVRHGVILSGTGTTGNVISLTMIFNNLLDGINEGAAADNNVWTHISTYNNSGLGIDKNALDDANNTISSPFPVITAVSFSGSHVTITGTASAFNPIFDTVNVELYKVAPDPSGFGEGKTFVVSTTAFGSGQWSVTVVAASAGCYTAFQTQVDTSLGVSRSSEFGPNSCRVFLPVVLR